MLPDYIIFPVAKIRNCQQFPINGEKVKQSGERLGPLSAAASWRQKSLSIYRTVWLVVESPNNQIFPSCAPVSLVVVIS